MDMKRLIDALIEGPVVPSFTKLGVGARSRLFGWTPLDSYDLSDMTIVLTGGTSGLGRAAGEVFAKGGASLVLVARNPEKAQRARAELTATDGNDRISVVIADMGDLDQVRSASVTISETHPVVHALIHNAGALFNERRETADGTEVTTQVQVAAPFLMTSMLIQNLKAAAPGRVITMSSGGMYTAGLDVSGLQMDTDSYKGTQQYARAKRAQVVLNEMWAKRFSVDEIVFHALHPGWADTPGVDDALPGFGTLLGPLLRSPAQGADTMVWLAADPLPAETSGRFWHDRAIRSTHKTRATAKTDTPERRAELWAWCEAHTGVEIPM